MTVDEQVLWVFLEFKVVVIASLIFVVTAKGISLTPEVQLYLRGKEVIVATQRWREGVIPNTKEGIHIPTASA